MNMHGHVCASLAQATRALGEGDTFAARNILQQAVREYDSIPLANIETRTDAADRIAAVVRAYADATGMETADVIEAISA